MLDYLDYATNQPMRDGEEIRDFLESDDDSIKNVHQNSDAPYFYLTGDPWDV